MSYDPYYGKEKLWQHLKKLQMNSYDRISIIQRNIKQLTKSFPNREKNITFYKNQNIICQINLVYLPIAEEYIVWGKPHI